MLKNLYKNERKIILFAAALSAACGAPSAVVDSPPQVTAPETKKKERPRPLCLVLSVGAEQGIAHIGVINSLRERGVVIDCVVGTSMGSLVGGLYAHKPDSKIEGRYKEIFSLYKDEATSETFGGGIVQGLFAGASSWSREKLGGEASGEEAPSEFTPLGVRKVEWKRLNLVLNKYFGQRTIESLPLRFVTSHQALTSSGAVSVRVEGGILAREVAASIANPLLFKDLKAEMGARIDPGLDRVASVPLQMACDAFPQHQFIVSNVTSEEIYTSKNTSCPYQEVKVSTPDVDRALAITGSDPGFQLLVDAGWAAAQDTVDLTRLPTLKRPARGLQNEAEELFKVSVTLRVEAHPRKSSGNRWDLLTSAPDIAHRTEVLSCTDCDAFGTSASLLLSGEGKADSFSSEFSLGVLSLRPGFVLQTTAFDSDVSQDDEMGVARAIFREPGSQVVVEIESARVIYVFKRVD